MEDGCWGLFAPITVPAFSTRQTDNRVHSQFLADIDGFIPLQGYSVAARTHTVKLLKKEIVVDW